MPVREDLLARTFVQLADTLVDDFDIIDLLTLLTDRCVQLLDAGAAGVMLADPQGQLHVVAASSEQVRLLELFQLQSQEGPCLECFTTGRAVVNEPLVGNEKWPRFAAKASAEGFRSVQALPMRLRDLVIGGLNVFLDDRESATDVDLSVGQALADASTIAVLHDQASREAQVIAAQLQGALTSRIAIEQAKGVLSARADVDMDEAFRRLRGYARSHNRHLSAVAADLVGGDLPPDAITALTTS